MSQVSGAFTIEIPVERLAEIIALRVVAMLGARQGVAIRDTPGTDTYSRAQEPDPGAGPRRGVEPGYGAVDETGVDVEGGEDPGRWT